MSNPRRRNRRVVRRYETSGSPMHEVILAPDHRAVRWRRRPERKGEIVDVSVAGMRVRLGGRVEVNQIFRIRWKRFDGRVRVRWVAPTATGADVGLVLLDGSEGFVTELHDFVARLRSPESEILLRRGERSP